MEYSEIGPSGVWMLTASPLKQGMTTRQERERIEGEACLVLRARSWFYRRGAGGSCPAFDKRENPPGGKKRSKGLDVIGREETEYACR